MKNVDKNGVESAEKRHADAPTEATDQKVRGSNPLRRAKKGLLFKKSSNPIFMPKSAGNALKTGIFRHFFLYLYKRVLEMRRPIPGFLPAYAILPA